MSGQDGLTPLRSLLLIQRVGGFTCKRSTKIFTLFSLQEQKGLIKRTQSPLSQHFRHCFSTCLNRSKSPEQQKQGFSLSLLKDDDYDYV